MIVGIVLSALSRRRPRLPCSGAGYARPASAALPAVRARPAARSVGFLPLPPEQIGGGGCCDPGKNGYAGGDVDVHAPAALPSPAGVSEEPRTWPSPGPGLPCGQRPAGYGRRGALLHHGGPT